MANTNLLFKKGNYLDFKKNILTGNNATEGTLYFTEDEGGLYLGKSSGEVQRIQGSLIFYTDTLTFNGEVISNPPYDENVIYFVASANTLTRWDASANKWVWTQLNSLTDEDGTVDKAALAQLQAALDDEIDRAKAAEALLASKEELNAYIGTNNGAVEALTTRVGEVEIKANATAAEIEPIKTSLSIIGAKSDTNTENIAKVEQTANNALPLSGGKMTGNITMSEESKIIFDTTYQPTEINDATNKQYVDQSVKTVDDKIVETNKTVANLSKNFDDHVDEFKAAKELIQANATAINEFSSTYVNKNDFNGSVSTINQNISKNEQDITAMGALVAQAQDTADNAIPQVNGTASGLKITSAPSEGKDAVNKEYVDNEIATKMAAADAMTFQGVLNSSNYANEREYNRGDAYKVSGTIALNKSGEVITETTTDQTVAITYFNGDLLIHQGSDGAQKPNWAHIESGYEDDYDQYLSVENNKIMLSNGIEGNGGQSRGLISLSSDSINITTKDSNVEFELVWGSFDTEVKN